MVIKIAKNRTKNGRLMSNKPNFDNYEIKMKAHNKRMKELRDDVKNLNIIPQEVLNKRKTV